MNKLATILVTAALLSASGCATDDSTGTKPVTATSAPSPEKTTLPVLKTGISSDEVVQLVGKPLQVEPRESPAGTKAEVWTYRRQVDDTTHQVATSVQNVAGYNPVTTAGPSQTPEMQFTTVHVRTFQVTQLLIVNDKLVTSKQWNDQTTSYDN